MYPGRLDEQPMPLMVMTSCGCSPSSASACLSACRTPKSPQPGHQSGSAWPLKSLTVSAGCVEEVTVSISVIIVEVPQASDQHLVDGDVLLRVVRQNLLHAFD